MDELRMNIPIAKNILRTPGDSKTFLKANMSHTTQPHCKGNGPHNVESVQQKYLLQECHLVGNVHIISITQDRQTDIQLLCYVDYSKTSQMLKSETYQDQDAA